MEWQNAVTDKVWKFAKTKLLSSTDQNRNFFTHVNVITEVAMRNLVAVVTLLEYVEPAMHVNVSCHYTNLRQKNVPKKDVATYKFAMTL